MDKLDNNWTFWLHLPHDIDWSIDSYKKLYTFNTLQNSIILLENMDKIIVEKCMLFIMKNNIKPIWEDPNNCQGGCFSYKIPSDNVNNIWKSLVYSIIGKSLTNNIELLESINGISISPKKNFCIIKIWISNVEELKDNIIYNYFNQENQENEENEETDPFNLHNICNIEPQLCKFKKHELLYNNTNK